MFLGRNICQGLWYRVNYKELKCLSVSTIEDMKHLGMIIESLSTSLFVNINTMSVDWRGIETRSPAWQARILPLNHQCLNIDQFSLKMNRLAIFFLLN